MKIKNFCLRCKKTPLLNGYLSGGIFLRKAKCIAWQQKICASFTKIKDIHKGCKKLNVLVGSIYEGARTENCTTSLFGNCSDYTKIKNPCQRAFIFALLVAYQVRGLLGDAYQARRNA